MSHQRRRNDIGQLLPRGYATRSSIALACIKIISVGLNFISFASATPLHHLNAQSGPQHSDVVAAHDWELWINLGTAIILVLLGGALAGLTIALMGQDEIYLQVIATSGEGEERRNAARVLWLLRKGKHWVLVTLLLGNVITNETLPIVLDRSIGGGWPAVAASTALVVIFGEIAPQSVCVRYGLPIGAAMAPFTLVLMWILFPVSWPIAKLLDYLLGEDHGTTYKKAGLKQLVTLHKTLGTTPGERLNQDEVTIISAVLDLKDKSVGSIMTPMDDVFTLSADAVLDEELMETIMREGYSRIPIHEPTRHGDFVGMLLVKMLITYDPEDCKRVNEFSLATLPETRPETSCLDIINFFQEGKSHMVLVSDYPGETYGALGVVTLEDVIEELIGEEIIDESDVFIDVHKAIRRMTPAPSNRLHGLKAEAVTDANNVRSDHDDHLSQLDDEIKVMGRMPASDSPRASHDSTLGRTRTSLSGGFGRSPTPTTTLYMRRKSASGGGVGEIIPVQMRGYTSEFKQQLRNLGPSNAANKPKSTRFNAVKIKPAAAVSAEHAGETQQTGAVISNNPAITTPLPTAAQEGVGRDLISPGHSAKDGVQAIAASYGFPDLGSSVRRAAAADVHIGSPSSPQDTVRPRSSSLKRSDSQSTLGSLLGEDGVDVSRSGSKKRATVRTGSITEQFVDAGGVKKLVLEMTSSSEEGGANQKQQHLGRSKYDDDNDDEEHEDGNKKKKKKRSQNKKKSGGSGAGEGSRGAGGGARGKGHHDEKMPLLTPR